MFKGEKCLDPTTIAKNLFLEFDDDNDGFIVYEEFKDMMEDIYENTIEENIREEFNKVDGDRSGRITLKGLLILSVII